MTGKRNGKTIREINEEQREYFNRNVDSLEPPLPAAVPQRLRSIVEAGRIQKGDSVLDVGTGTGVLIRYMIQYGPAEIHGCDLAENMLARVHEKYPDVITHLGDVVDLDLPDGSIGAAFINGCFSNIMDKEGTLKNLHRMLREGGRLVISHPLGRPFIIELRKVTPYPLDLLPDEKKAREMFERHDFFMETYTDEPEFFLTVGVRR